MARQDLGPCLFGRPPPSRCTPSSRGSLDSDLIHHMLGMPSVKDIETDDALRRRSALRPRVPVGGPYMTVPMTAFMTERLGVDRRRCGRRARSPVDGRSPVERSSFDTGSGSPSLARGRPPGPVAPAPPSRTLRRRTTRSTRSTSGTTRPATSPSPSPRPCWTVSSVSGSPTSATTTPTSSPSPYSNHSPQAHTLCHRFCGGVTSGATG